MNNWIKLACVLSLCPFSTASARAAVASTQPIEIALPSHTADIPAIFVHLPAPDHRTGAAVIICPGGGYSGLTLDSEGHDTAQWFADQGVTGIVLKYRLPNQHGSTHASPLEDAHAAILTVRERAANWGIDPHRVGILGYSAGGHVASTAGTHYDANTRPDFMMLIYPVITMTGEYAHAGSRANLLGKHPDPDLVKLYSNELQVTRDTPPAFIAMANDDTTVNPMNGILFYSALHDAGVSVELHMYQVGGHGLKGGAGWGIGGNSRSISSTWPLRAMEWMKQRKLLSASN
jgi:acetyl esterase/lipase